MTLSRRELLRLAGSALGAPGLATLAAACGGGAASRSASEPVATTGLRPLLRELVEELEAHYPVVTALAIRGSRARLALDDAERAISSQPLDRVLFQIYDGSTWHAEQARSLASSEVVAAARRVQGRASAGSGGERPTRSAPPRDFLRRGEVDVRRAGPAAWLERLEPLLEATHRGRGSSRIIYRGAFLDIDDSDTWFVGDGQDLHRSVSRVRAGAALLCWTGREMIAEEASRAGTGGLELAAVAGDELEAAARRALTLTAGAPAAGGDGDVVLDPSVVALLFRRGVAELLRGEVWQSGASRLADFAGDQIGDARVSLTDDPTLRGGYASYDFDDEGWLTSRRPLLVEGVVTAPFTDRRSAMALGRMRTGHARCAGFAVPAPHPSNLLVHPGRHRTEDLIGGVDAGYLIEGGLLAACDPLRWRVMVRAHRAHEIRRGSLTGRVLGPATIHAGVKDLLLGIRGGGAELSWHTEPGEAPVAVLAPHLLTRAEVSA